MTSEDRFTARIAVSMTTVQRSESQRIAQKMDVTHSWHLRWSLERTIKEADGGPLLPLHTAADRRDAA